LSYLEEKPNRPAQQIVRKNKRSEENMRRPVKRLALVLFQLCFIEKCSGFLTNFWKGQKLQVKHASTQLFQQNLGVCGWLQLLKRQPTRPG